jgi:hypothetical protein
MAAPLSLTPKTQARPIGNPGRDLDRQGFGLFNTSLTVAGWAGMGYDLALAMAPRTGGTYSKKPLGLDYLSPAAAGGAIFGLAAGFKAVSLAKGTGLHPGNFQFHFFALGRFHERDGKIISQVRPFPGPGLASPSSSPQPEKIFKYIPETGKNILKTAEAAETGILQTLMAESVIKLAFLRIMQDLIGLGRFFEPFFRLLVPRVSVRVVFEGHFPVGLFDFLFVCLPGNLQDFVVIPFMVVVWHIVIHTFHSENLFHAF